jgi:penicillin-binding protein 1A
MDSLYRDETFMSALKNDKSRLEAGLVSIDPRNGYVKAWVGGRNLADDWYDHVAKARRQPGSTFKPFVYIAAIDNGYSPQHTFKDTLFYWSDSIGNEWSPTNSDGSYTNRWMTLREGLKYSLNTITGQLVLQVGAPTVADYARWMGIRSPLNEVPSLALGTSNVTLLELTTAYSTLANGGLYYEPTVVTRIEDQLGNVLYEARPQPNEALSDQTAFKVIDMMREVVQTGGTGARIRWQYQLHDYDFAGKTGTTQNSADGWFMLMHPELVTGAWVGWNDQRMTFRTNWWGQGAHNALFLVGDYTRKIVDDGRLSKENFPLPIDFGNEASEETLPTPSRDNRRVIW